LRRLLRLLQVLCKGVFCLNCLAAHVIDPSTLWLSNRRASEVLPVQSTAPILRRLTFPVDPSIYPFSLREGLSWTTSASASSAWATWGLTT
jgi:hypothetical protein